LAVIAGHAPGATKRELTEALRREETNRGLTFEYCLITAGTSLNRAPSEQRWDRGDILSLDSGGNYHGYIGDLCRMAIHGEPDAELVDLLDEIEAIQRVAMKPIRAGVMGAEVYAAADPLVRASKQHNHMHFLAHGMGLVSHEAPRLTASGPVPYDAYDATRPLESGMVVSRSEEHTSELQSPCNLVCRLLLEKKKKTKTKRKEDLQDESRTDELGTIRVRECIGVSLFLTEFNYPTTN